MFFPSSENISGVSSIKWELIWADINSLSPHPLDGKINVMYCLALKQVSCLKILNGIKQENLDVHAPSSSWDRPKNHRIVSPENMAREVNALPHTLVVQTAEALVGEGSVTLLGRSLFAKPGEGSTILILASLRKAPDEHLSLCHWAVGLQDQHRSSWGMGETSHSIFYFLHAPSSSTNRTLILCCPCGFWLHGL